MFIEVTYKHCDKMFWLLTVLTVAACAPLAQDPGLVGDSDLVRNLDNLPVPSEFGNNSKSENAHSDILSDEFKNAFQELRETNYADVNKFINNVDKDILDGFLNYTNNKHWNKAVREWLKQTDHGDISATDLTLFNTIFDYIDVNKNELLKSLGYTSRKIDKSNKSQFRKLYIEKPSVSYRKLNIDFQKRGVFSRNSIYALLDQLYPQFTDNAKTDKTKGRYTRDELVTNSRLDVGVQPFLSEESAFVTLKTLYEKKGGVCSYVNGYKNSPIYVISKCPFRNIPANIKELCEHNKPFSRVAFEENSIDITQTLIQDADGFVYKNIYCAQCNDVTSVNAWSTKLDCNELQSLELSDGQEKVTFMDGLTDTKTGCRRIVEPAINQMIHECSKKDVISILGHRGHQTRIGDNAKSSPFPLSFSILMNFGFDGKTHILFSTKPNEQVASSPCEKKDEMYDPINEKCRLISCSDGYERIDGKCTKVNGGNAESNADELSHLTEMEEAMQVVLTLKNISLADYVLLQVPSIDELLVYDIAEQFNISSERIQNLTMTFGSNVTSGNLIEIVKLTPGPVTDNFFTPRNEPPYDTNNIETTNVEDDENIQKNTTGNHTTGQHKDTHQLHPTTTATADLKPDTQFSPTSTTSSTDVWQQRLGMSVKISFIVNPAHRNKSNLEKSVKSVLRTMTNLIDTNQFMLTVNGSEFQVQGLEDMTSMDEFCTKGFQWYLEQDKFDLISFYDVSSGTNVTVVKLNETGAQFWPGEYDVTVSLDGVVGNLNQTTCQQFAFVCVMPKIADEKCGRIVLNKTEYDVHSMSKDIHFANHTYNISEYEYANEELGTVRICTPDWSTSQIMYNVGEWALACGEEMTKIVIAESYLTFILGVISLVSMLTVLITYGLFEKLRNLPGINTMNLTLALFLGGLIFITSGWIKAQESAYCSAVGMILHYLFLASFFWMNVMSFDVYRTFARKCILRRVRDKKTYVPRYALYGWGMPLLIVGICAFLDFSQLFDGVRIGYGGISSAPQNNQPEITIPANSTSSGHVYSIGCWIQEPVASMAAFGGPMILILSSNVVMFSRTIVSIRASTKSTKDSVRRSSVSHMTGHDDVMLYIRMSTVMGFTWIFGLASSLVSAFAGTPTQTTCIIMHLIGILFIVFNCSQGIFIFFAFVFNRRVFALYRGLVYRIRHRRDRPVSLSSSRGTLAVSVSHTSISHVT